MTIILQHNEIKQCVTLDESLIPIVENAFISLSQGKTNMPDTKKLATTGRFGAMFRS